MLFGAGTLTVRAQDPQFSQFYAAPLYLNPAFTGTAEAHRIITNFRNQWPQLPQAFNTYSLSYDYNLQKLRSGIGLLLVTDRAGSANLNDTQLSFSYSYRIQINKTIVVSSGLQFTYGNRFLDVNKLFFGDQISGGSSVPISIDPSIQDINSTQFFDFSSGLVVYSKVFWGGFSIYHMNTPNYSMLDMVNEINMKISIHGGAKIPLIYTLRKGVNIPSLSPTFIYKQQGDFRQLDIGLQFTYEPIKTGVWYRGVPLVKNPIDAYNQDALIFLFGVQFPKFEITYSYDFNISQLGSSSGGAHEASLIYRFKHRKSNRKKTRRRQKYIPCPAM
ncbi:type IX secretion system membrane protein PorP/SprF [Cytophagales bacterium RKSG123]|nr:type IX secretion system membrane protein PorP/SprF [Xanthovirga aplysinae]